MGASMRIVHALAAIAALLTTTLLLVAPASAQATRTWVSGVGDDANPCSRTAPCKTFAGAISKTAAAGEINCLDPGGFGAVTIVKAMTIDCKGVGNGGVVVSGTPGITVNVPPGAYVQLIGLDLNGVGGLNGQAPSGTNGVQVIQGGNVAIIDCLIYGFQGSTGGGGTGGAGVYIANSATPTHVDIENTYIRDNTNGVTVSGSVTGSVLIDHSVLESNLTNNVLITTNFDPVVLQASVLSGAPTAISNTGGGAVVSYGNNLIRNPGAPTQTVPLQ
jgi:hypothetical protein